MEKLIIIGLISMLGMVPLPNRPKGKISDVNNNYLIYASSNTGVNPAPYVVKVHDVKPGAVKIVPF